MWKARATATEKIELKPRARRPATSKQATAIIIKAEAALVMTGA